MSLSPVDPKIKGNTDSNSNRPPTPVNLVQPKHQQHNTCARSGPKAETEALIPLMDHVAAYGESKNFFYSTHASTQREPGPCSSEEANGTLPLDAQLRNSMARRSGQCSRSCGSAPAPTRSGDLQATEAAAELSSLSQLLTRATSASSHTYRRSGAGEMLVSDQGALGGRTDSATSHTLVSPVTKCSVPYTRPDLSMATESCSH